MQLKIEKSWHQILKEELNLPYIGKLKTFIEEEKKKGLTVYPPLPLIFNASYFRGFPVITLSMPISSTQLS